MKKLLFVLTFILGVFCTAQAGYLIRKITGTNVQGFKNFTLTLDNADEPVSAGSMIYGGYHSIVIVRANLLTTANIFQIPIDNCSDIEVRDFHYLEYNDTYLLCGAITINQISSAFVAVINRGVRMDFMVHPEASIYYSIWGGNFPISGIPALQFYACGANGSQGVIARIDRVSLQLTLLHKTDIDWEYHKITAKKVSDILVVIVASGRDPECRYVGFTTINIPGTAALNYYWEQRTEPASHSVFCNDIFTNNTIVLASSYQTVLTLNPVTFPPSIIPAYRFFLGQDEKYCVQDIGMFKTEDGPRISVAGYLGMQPQTTAWFGSVLGLSSTSIMDNYYFNHDGGRNEHYKIRGDQFGKQYTGGYSEDVDWGALFSTPLIPSEECDDMDNSYPIPDHVHCYTFNSTTVVPFNNLPIIITSVTNGMEYVYECHPFKGETAPKSTPAETEITASPDRITIKDAPANTKYQIYNTIGQLIQTGATNPDISTANLNKGVYILRLENGKTVKFVK